MAKKKKTKKVTKNSESEAELVLGALKDFSSSFRMLKEDVLVSIHNMESEISTHNKQLAIIWFLLFLNFVYLMFGLTGALVFSFGVVLINVINALRRR